MMLGEEQKFLKYFRRFGEICSIGGFLFATNNTLILIVVQQMRQNLAKAYRDGNSDGRRTTQDEIALQFKCSKSTVSRAVSEAKELSSSA